MVNTETIRIVVGIIGNVISFGLFISPAPTFVTILKRKSVGDFSPMPYIATIMNCMLWVFYGTPVVHPHSILVLTINGIGLFLEIIYLTLFFIFADKKNRLKIIGFIFLELVFISAIILGTLLGLHTYDDRSKLVGTICIVFGIIMYGSPLTIMKTVIVTKSVEYMPFSISMASFSNGICWLIYALLRFDLYILISNGVGAVLGAAQLILYFCYWKPGDQNEKKSSQVQLSSSSAMHNMV
ncbi:PREDICTED: bidirectional sugar transporter SWEET5-like [Nelumbo nucifera]|uniref:Bidirectional sugar transporter SWEET n=2 Tax=Nelumbo nucifera TaxID=4432 RepID=A0A1U7ZIF4_NELNU|nr:PREDICTED: bidirectional sugar transporter SWEET5-like [Nelumbo nucifera]DAD34612.1 TPA_asm: hypothetical protein HUJ06_005252 [Nelumbo nucifera]